jgi:outer membrane protein TolC
MRSSLSVAVLLACTCLFWRSAAAAEALSLPAAQQLALERSRQLAGQDQAVAAAREMAVAAGQLPDPVLSAGVENLPVSGADRFSLTNDFMTMRRIGLMQELTAADKRQLRAARFERSAEKAAAERLANAADIERDAAQAWLDLYYAQAASALLATLDAAARAELEAAEGAYRGGRSAQADVLAARSALLMVQDRTSDAGRRVDNARTTLARWTGREADLSQAAAPAIDQLRYESAALDHTFSRLPHLAVMGQEEAIARTEADLARANLKPDWTVEVAFQQRGPGNSNMMSFGVSVPLQWDRRQRQDRELSAKLAMAEQIKAEREEAMRAHMAEGRIMLADWSNGRERLARYQKALVPLAQQRSEAVLAAYRGGKSSLVEVMAARRAEIDTRLQALQMEADVARLWAQLNFVIPAASKEAP